MADLKALLAKHKIDQWEVAGACGVSQPTISRWCSGARTPKGQEVLALLAFLRRFEPRLAYEDLFGGEPARPPLRGRLRSLLRYLVGAGLGR